MNHTHTYIQTKLDVFHDALMKISKFRTPIHTAHIHNWCSMSSSQFLLLIVNVHVLCILAGSMCAALTLALTTTIKSSFTVSEAQRTAGCYTFQCRYRIQFSLFGFPLSRSLTHPLLRSRHRKAVRMSEKVSERASVSCVSVLVSFTASVCVFANFKFQSGFFQLNTFRIQYRLR